MKTESKKGKKNRKYGRNVEKCKSYRLSGRDEKNAARRQARAEKRKLRLMMRAKKMGRGKPGRGGPNVFSGISTAVRLSRQPIPCQPHGGQTGTFHT